MPTHEQQRVIHRACPHCDTHGPKGMIERRAKTVALCPNCCRTFDPLRRFRWKDMWSSIERVFIF